MAGIIQYLLQAYNPRAIITGSYADGTFNEDSDFDCRLIGRDETRAFHDTSIVNDVELQAEIYSMHDFMCLPLRQIEFFVDVVIACAPRARQSFAGRCTHSISLICGHGFPARGMHMKQTAAGNSACCKKFLIHSS